MNFTKAAEDLHITQPAVSQHIKYIETYYDVKLFEYHNKKLSLTEQGQYLKNVFETIHHDSLRIKDDVAAIRKPQVLKIGATLSIGEFFLPPLLPEFLKSHTDINISVTVDNTRELLKLLNNGQIDFALCEGYFNKSDYEYRLIKREKILALCAADYDICGVLEISSLFSHRLLAREKGSGTREIFERYLKENGFSSENFTSCCEFTSPHLILKMLLAGQGISFLYRTVAEECLRDGTLKEIDINGFDISHEFNAIWKKQSIFSDRYIKIIKDLCNC
jgi:DNA-binding transcriptional LysR family regulator